MGGVAALGALVLTGYGCGSPSAPTVTPDPAKANMTIVMTSSGVSPAVLTVPAGTRVLFVNNDTRSRDMSSDPHPEHTDCPEINAIGFISPGQTKETGNLNTTRTCRYHDHGNPDNTGFQGRIVIQ
jgi:plastocyanin